ncbi:hypothetical protein RUM44_007257 [Polyplax serrata]|uniref:Uncharacterized protein n=1 Tax=Polyplax serrata TaxID=468196 RepID=A0ABR1B099_POLSC
MVERFHRGAEEQSIGSWDRDTGNGKKKKETPKGSKKTKKKMAGKAICKMGVKLRSKDLGNRRFDRKEQFGDNPRFGSFDSIPEVTNEIKSTVVRVRWQV